RVLIVFILLVLVSSGTSAQTTGSFDVKRIDHTCKPCEDFYQFINGNWIKENPVPPAYARWGTFQILQEENQKTLREILESASASTAAAGTNEQIVGAFYGSCMDEARIESLGPTPIAGVLARIEKIRTIQDLQGEIARLQDAGVPTVFLFGASYDFKNSS